MKESHVQQLVRLALSEAGATMFRNNIGAFQDRTGRWVHYGVANPGGADLIGWTPITVTADMVGKKLAVFTAVEIKGLNGKPTQAQFDFLMAVIHAGGYAGVAKSAEEAVALLQR